MGALKFGMLTLAICSCGLAFGGPAGDPQLVALLEEPYVSPADFLVKVTALEDLMADRGDPRAVFAGMYRVLTERGIDSVNAGAYADGNWVSRMMTAFANLYRQALLDYECGRVWRVPQAWQVAFEAAEADDVPVFYHGLLGVYAHINHDLPFAFAEVTPRAERAARFPDFLQTHAVVLASIDAVEDAAVAYAARLGCLDSAVGLLDEAAFANLLTAWRFGAWNNAALFKGMESMYGNSFQAVLLNWTTGARARSLRAEGAILFALLPR